MSTPAPARPWWHDALDEARNEANERGKTLHARLSEELFSSDRPEIGPYRVERMLGRGGWGSVWLAIDPRLERRVAIKVLQPSAAEGEARGSKRLLREARAAAAVSHPNVVEIFDVGATDQGDVFIAMEYIDGPNVEEWLRQEPRPSADEIIERFVAAGKGLAAAHAAGLVHRDFKPSNVFMDARTRAKVGDFGLAESAAALTRSRIGGGDSSQLGTDPRLTQTGNLVGTPRYMSPEQHNGAPLSPTSDIYSFCLSLLEALRGENPFPGKDLDELRHAKSFADLRWANFAGIPARAARVIRRGLAPKPADRWPSMDHLLRALKAPRRWPIVLALVALVAVPATAASLLLSATPQSCAAPAIVWSPGVQDQIGRQFKAVPVPFAEASFAETSRRLSAYADEVDHVRNRACDGLEGAMRETTLDCADRRDRDLEALIEVFRSADVEVVSNAVVAAARLPPPQWCLANDASVRPPVSPGTERLRGQLDSVVALERAGRYEAGLALATKLEAAAREEGPNALLAAALTERGRLQLLTGASDGAEAALLQAFALAQAENQDATSLSAATLLIEHAARAGGTAAETDKWVRHAGAALERLGGSFEGAAELEVSLGLLAHARGQADETRSHFERALSLYESAGHGGDIMGAVTRSSLAVAFYAMGDYEESARHHDESLKTLVQFLGRSHPIYAGALDNAAAVHSALGDYQRAATMHSEALAILDALPSVDPVGRSITLNNLAAAQRRLGQTEAARQNYRAAITLTEAALGPEHPELLSPLNNLGSLERGDKAFDLAVHLHGRALQIAEASLSPGHPTTLESKVGLGYARYGTGDTEAAVKLFTEATDSCTAARQSLSCGRALFGRAKARHDIEAEPVAALEDARKAREVIEQLPGAHAEDLDAIGAWLDLHARDR